MNEAQGTPPPTEAVMKLEKIEKELEKTLSPKRFRHSAGVAEMARHLAHLYGSVLAKTAFGIDDEEIRGAIYYHTTGRVGMTLLEKIVFLADYIEPNRDFPGVEDLRLLAEKDLDEAVLAAYDSTISHLIDQEAYSKEKRLLRCECSESPYPTFHSAASFGSKAFCGEET